MEASDGGGDEQSGLKESTSFINLSAAVDGHVDWQGERVTGDSDEEEGEDKKSTEHEKNASHADPLAEERPLAPPTTPITNRKLAEALDGMVTDSYRVTTLLSTCCSTMFSYAKLTVNKALYCCPPFADDSSSVKSMKQS